MAISRREFVRGGVAAFTVSFAAPAFLNDIARAQGRSRRNLVVLYLSGGNDSLSTVIPYNDPNYYARRPAVIQRTGYPNQSRSHFEGTDIWSTADPTSPAGTGWLGRYLDQLPTPVDPLTAWNTQRETPRTLLARTVGVPAITSVAGYAFASPNGGTDAVF